MCCFCCSAHRANEREAFNFYVVHFLSKQKRKLRHFPLLVLGPNEEEQEGAMKD